MDYRPPIEVGSRVKVIWHHQPHLGWVVAVEPTRLKVSIKFVSGSTRKWFPRQEVELHVE